MGDDDEIRRRKGESGWRFDPFDEELISDYLKPKLLGKQFPPCNVVDNRQVYGPGSNPWQVFDPSDHHSNWLKSPHIKPTQKYMFVFAKLSKLSSSGTSKNTSKKAGCGTWVGKTSRKKIRDGDGNVIGESRYLVFEVNDTHSAAVGVGVDLSQVGSYTMHEYRLSGINEALNSAADTLVVCKITHDSSKRPTLALKSSAARIADFCGSGSTTSEAQIKEENDNIPGGTGSLTTENLGGVCDALDETRALTSKNLIALDGGVGDNLEEKAPLTSESLAVITSDVGECYNAAPQYNNGLQYWWDDCGAGFSLDDLGGFSADWFAACLDSNHEEEEPVENSKPGKRKSEDNEDSCQLTKKICL